METAVVTFIAAVASSVTIAKTPAILRTQASHVRLSWIFMALFSLTITVQISPVYATIDQLTGANNLAWFLAYFSLAVGLYILVRAIQAMLDEPVPAWAHILLLIVVPLLTVLYAGWIMHTPEWNSLAHQVPRSPADLAFMLTEYVYAAALVTIPKRAFTYHYRHHANTPANRYRLGVLAAGSAIVILYFLSKVGVALAGYLLLPLTVPLILAKISMPVAGLTWPLAYIPIRWIVGPINYIDSLLTLRDVRQVYLRLTDLCPYVPRHKMPLLIRQIKDPHVYSLLYVASILDSRKALAVYGQEQQEVDINKWIDRLRTVETEDAKALIQECRRLKQHV